MSESIYSTGLFNNPNVTKRAKAYILGVMLGGIASEEKRESFGEKDSNALMTDVFMFFDRQRKPYMLAFQSGVASSLTNSVVPGIAKQPSLFSGKFLNEMDRILSGEYDDKTVAEMVCDERKIMFSANDQMNRESWVDPSHSVKGIESVLKEIGKKFEFNGEIGERGVMNAFIDTVSPIFTAEKKNSIASNTPTAQA